MKTKEEILKDVKSSKAQFFSAYYTFDKGENIKLNIPKNFAHLEKDLIQELIKDEQDINLEHLLSLLYYINFKDVDRKTFKEITGVISEDPNLYSEDNKAKAKTPAQAAFNPKTKIVSIRKDLFVGSEKDVALDLLSVFHECRHYYQLLEQKPFVKHLDGTIEGSVSDIETLRTTFYSLFKSEEFSESDYNNYKYALYYQGNNEFDARQYAENLSINLLKQALQSKNISETRKTQLNEILKNLYILKEENNKRNKETKEICNHLAKISMERALDIQSKVSTELSPEKIKKLQHYSEFNRETEKIRQYIFDLEASLFIHYDQNIANLIQDIVLKYKVYAVGRNLVKNPNFTPKQETIDAIIEDDMLLKLGGSSLICPPYEFNEISERYATILYEKQFTGDE